MSAAGWFFLGSFVALAPCLFVVALIFCRYLEGKPCARNRKTR